jgi:hypothetical protein
VITNNSQTLRGGSLVGPEVFGPAFQLFAGGMGFGFEEGCLLSGFIYMQFCQLVMFIVLFCAADDGWFSSNERYR